MWGGGGREGQQWGDEDSRTHVSKGRIASKFPQLEDVNYETKVITPQKENQHSSEAFNNICVEHSVRTNRWIVVPRGWSLLTG